MPFDITRKDVLGLRLYLFIYLIFNEIILYLLTNQKPLVVSLSVFFFFFFFFLIFALKFNRLNIHHENIPI